MSKIVRLNRAFRPRLEVSHRQAVPTQDWSFAMQHIGEHGRRFVGEFEDVAVAFSVAVAFRNRGNRIVFIDRDRVRP